MRSAAVYLMNTKRGMEKLRFSELVMMQGKPPIQEYAVQSAFVREVACVAKPDTLLAWYRRLGCPKV
jgi:hypothetical protein